MRTQVPVSGKEVPRLDIPEDVAVLYAWADLQGARYRDFSASRRESRAQARQRAAQSLRDAEASAKTRAEQNALKSEEAARQAEAKARRHEAKALHALGEGRTSERELEQIARERAVREAAELSRRAAQERLLANLRAQTERLADVVVRQEAREVEEAHASAERQAWRYAEATHAGLISAQSPGELPSINDPHERVRLYAASKPAEFAPGLRDAMRPERFPSRRQPQGATLDGNSTGLLTVAQHQVPSGAYEAIVYTFPTGLASEEMVRPFPEEAHSRAETDAANSERAPVIPAALTSAEAELEQFHRRATDLRRSLILDSEPQGEGMVPAWLYHSAKGSGLPSEQDPSPRRVAEESGVAQTLQRSRERVASRWYALRGVFDPDIPAMAPTHAREQTPGSPLLAVFSLAGGVGKTSLTAALGRSLSSVGDRVLLADVTLNNVLPFYFGATEVRPGVLRTFSPRPESTDALISLLSRDLLGESEELESAGVRFAEELQRVSGRFDRVIVDLSPAAGGLLQRLVASGATVLVPVVPDMNAVISLAATERFFHSLQGSEAGTKVRVRYLLTQFEPSLPLHLDVREVMTEKMGHRLLPFVIRRSPAVAEALAEGMTVMDYAAGAGVAADYRDLANWLRLLLQPARTTEQQSQREKRW